MKFPRGGERWRQEAFQDGGDGSSQASALRATFSQMRFCCLSSESSHLSPEYAAFLEAVSEDVFWQERVCCCLGLPRGRSISKYKFMTGSDRSPNANRGLTPKPTSTNVLRCLRKAFGSSSGLSSSHHETNVLRRRHTSPPHKHNSQWIIAGLKSVQVANKLQATLHGCLFFGEKGRAVEHNVSVSDHVDHLPGKRASRPS